MRVNIREGVARMQPNVEIRKMRERYFNYGVSVALGDELYARQGLRSMAECLHDAATALGLSFPMATISYEGVVLGEYSIPTMEHDTVLLAKRLHVLLAETTE